MSKFILADPSEERHLHQSVRELSQFVRGVEETTGADFVITPLSIPSSNPALIRRHARAGLCVQRKDIGDLLASIKDGRLWTQMVRLLEVTDTPWLLVIGDLKCDRMGNAVVDGRDTEMKYGAMITTLDHWQMRGGYVTWLSRDTLISNWATMWHSALLERDKNGGEYPIKVVRKPLQLLYPLPDIVKSLLTLPGVGEEKARAIYDLTLTKTDQPTLMDCLNVLSDERIDGIGKTIRDRCMDYIGWQDINQDEIQQEENTQ